MDTQHRTSPKLIHHWWVLCLLIPLFHFTTVLIYTPDENQSALPDPPAQAHWFVDSWRMPGPGIDFFSFYQAGLEYYRGESIYKPLRPDAEAPYFYPYRYLPPLAAVSGATLGWLSPWNAYRIWLGLIMLSFFASLYMVHRLLAGNPLRSFVLAAWSLNPLLFLELWIGQVNLITATALLAAAYWGKQKRIHAALGAWSAAVLLKVYPLIIGIVFVRKHLLKPLGITLLLLVVAVLLSFVAAGQSMGEFWGRNFNSVITANFHSGNQGFAMLLFYGLRHAFSMDTCIVLLRLWQVLLIGGAAAVIWYRKPPISIGVMVMAVTYLLSYHNVWSHHFLLLLPAASVFLAEAWSRGHKVPIILAGLALATLLHPGLFSLFNEVAYLDFYPGRGWTSPQQLAFRLVRLVPLICAAISGTMLLFDRRQRSAS